MRKPVDEPLEPDAAPSGRRKVLVWHWGRRGAGPAFGARLAGAFAALEGYEAALSLAAGAEILAGPEAPACAWRETTYDSVMGAAVQVLTGPAQAGRVDREIAAIAPELAICAMPAFLDRRMIGGLRRAGIPYAVVVHDAAGHPGEALNFWAVGQTRMFSDAVALFPLSGHVEDDAAGAGLWRQDQEILAPAVQFRRAGAGAAEPRRQAAAAVFWPSAAV